MTVKGLETALFHEVPMYRRFVSCFGCSIDPGQGSNTAISSRVCRKETYCVKSMIWHALLAATERVDSESVEAELTGRAKYVPI